MNDNTLSKALRLDGLDLELDLENASWLADMFRVSVGLLNPGFSEEVEAMDDAALFSALIGGEYDQPQGATPTQARETAG